MRCIAVNESTFKRAIFNGGFGDLSLDLFVTKYIVNQGFSDGFGNTHWDLLST